MNEDMSEMIKNFSQMLNNQQMPDNIKNILSSFSNNSNTNNNSNSDNNNSQNNCSTNNTSNVETKTSTQSNCTSSSQTSTQDCNNFNNNCNNSTQNNNSNNIFGDLDINTIFKIQKIFNSINNDKQNDSRTNLLMSLKPYLKDSRKSKVDQYIQLMKMGKVFEVMNPLGGDKKNV